MFTKLHFNAKYLVAKFLIYNHTNVTYINSLDIYIYFFYLYNILEITTFYKTNRELEFKKWSWQNFTNHFNLGNIIVTY